MESIGVNKEKKAHNDYNLNKKSSGIDINNFLKNCIYYFPQSDKFFSRCIDGRYDKQNGLNPLAYPGADIGQIMCITAAFNDINFQKLLQKIGVNISNDYYYIIKDTIESVVGGPKNISFHTDIHYDKDSKGSGGSHILQIINNPEDYGLNQQDIEFMRSFINKWESAGVDSISLQGNHNERAIVFISSGDSYSIYPKISEENKVFVFHEPLMQERNKFIANELIENGILNGYIDNNIIKLLENKLNEYTYFHLNETYKKLADGLPLYKVSIESNGNFKIH